MSQQQPVSYRGGDDDDDEMSVSLVEETGVPGGNHQPTVQVSNKLSHIQPVPSPSGEPQQPHIIYIPNILDH